MKVNGKKPISQWAEDDRPREKMLLKGKHTLSNTELLAIVINTGTGNMSALDLSRELMETNSNNLQELAKRNISELIKIQGIGKAKAIAIVASIELGKRILQQKALNRKKISCSKDVFEIMQAEAGFMNYESFWMVLLDRANKILNIEKISEGGISGTIADPKKIFKYAIDRQASSIILCHNHPSGNTDPSEADIRLTNKLIKASDFLDLQILDHIIIGNQNYFSFADNNRL